MHGFLPPHAHGPLSPSVAAQRLWIGACAFCCRVFVDGIEQGQHLATGHTPFWVDLAVGAMATSTHELVIMADNRCNGTTAPLHTRGDFCKFGGITRSVVLHQVPTAAASPRGRGRNSRNSSGAAFFKGVGVKTAGAVLGHVDISLSLGGAFQGARFSVAFDGGAAALFRNELRRLGRRGGRASKRSRGPKGGSPPAAWSADASNLHTVTVTRSPHGLASGSWASILVDG